MKKNKLGTQLVWVTVLTVMLTLGASLVLPLVSERALRRETVLADMTRVWGAPQLVAGPVGFGEDGAIEMASLTVEGDFKTSMRRKGIYRFPMYAAKLNLTGTLKSSGSRKILLKSRSRLRIENARLGSEAIYFNEIADNGTYLYRAPVSGSGRQLSFTLSCEGLQSFGLVHTAGETQVRLKSDWNDPGFFGDFLPVEYDIQKSGFTSSWRITGPGARKWAEASVENRQGALPGSFGVNFYQPVDIYQTTERSVKYAILFIGLTLMALFLFEVVSSASIHPMQYFLAGSALVIFYLLLLALAEFVGFTPAYMIAAVANVALITRYCGSFLLSRGQAAAFCLIISGLYTLLYVILQLEEAALLSGSLTLFAVLALTMYLTRRVDWYQLGATNQTGQR